MPNSAVLKNHINVSANGKSGSIEAAEKASNFLFSVSPADIDNYARSGNDLIIEFKNGQKFEIRNFFSHGMGHNNLVFMGGDAQWLVNFNGALSSEGDGIIDSKVSYEKITDSDSTKTLLAILGGVAVAGAGAGMAGGGGGGDKNGGETTKTEPPAKPSAPPAAWDNTGEITGPIKPGDFTDERQPELSGKGTPGHKIVIRDNGKVIGETEIDEDGNWKWMPEKPLDEGDHKITVSEKDKAGNESAPSDSIDFAVDTTPPATPTVPPVAWDNTGDITGEIKSGDFTDERQPELSGKGDPGDKIVIRDNGKVIGEVKVGEDGNWKWTPEKPLDEGKHSITVSEKDPAGNESGNSPSLDFGVETGSPDKPSTPPAAWDNSGDVTGPIESGKPTDERQPELSGEGKPGNTIVIRDGDKEIGEVKVDEDGKWKWKPETPLDEGKHDITTAEKNKAGNEGERSDAIVIDVDTTPPATPSVPPVAWDNTGDITGPIKPGDSTDERQPKLSGEGTSGNTIVIRDNGKVIGETKIDKDGNWKWTPEKPLDEGKHSITVSEKNKVGNVSAPSDSIDFVVDTTPPGTPVPPVIKDREGNEINANSPTNEEQPRLSGKGEPGNTIIIRDGEKEIGRTEVDQDGNWKWQVEKPLDEGDHRITVSEKDKAGNESRSSDSIGLEIDTTPPATPTVPPVAWDNTGDITGEIKSGDFTDERQPELSGKGDPGDKIVIRDNGKVIGEVKVGEDGNWKWTPEKPLDEGKHSITVSEKDPAGNESGNSPSLDFGVETGSPDKPSTPPAAWDNSGDVTGPIESGKPTDERQPELSGEGKPGNTIVIRDGDKEIGEVKVDEDGKWKWKPETPLDEGKHDITTAEKNKAGNEGERSDAIVIDVDTTPPATPSVPPVAWDNTGDITGPIKPGDSTDERQPELSGKGEPGDTIVIRDNGKVIGETAIDKDGNWNWKPETPLGDGNHRITVSEKDRASNESGRSPSLDFEVDSKAPTAIAVLESISGDTGTSGDFITTDNALRYTIKVNEKLGAGETVWLRVVGDNGDTSGWIKAQIGTDGRYYVDNRSTIEALTIGNVLADGKYTIETAVRDRAGNEGPVSKQIIEIHATPPETPNLTEVIDHTGDVTGSIHSGDTTDELRPVLKGVGAAGHIINIYDHGKLVGQVIADEAGNWTWTPQSGDFADGLVALTVSQTNQYGKESAHSPEFAFTIDTAKLGDVSARLEAISEDTGIAGDFETGDNTLKFTVKVDGDLKDGDIVRLRIVYPDGTKSGWLNTVALGDGRYELDYTGNVLADGNYVIETIVQSKIGNRSETSRQAIIIDSVSPDVPVITDAWDNIEPIIGRIEHAGATNDTRPVFTGNAEPGSTVIIRDGENVIGSAVVNGNGLWTWQPDEKTPLDAGDHKISVSAKDTAGNESSRSPSLDFTVDTQAPEVPASPAIEDKSGNPIESGSETNEDRPVLKGEGDPGDTIVIRDGDKEIGQVKVGEDGKWQWQPETPLEEGKHEIAVSEKDPAGNESKSSDPVIVDVDTTPPATPAVPPMAWDNTGDITGEIKSGASTDERQPEFKGRGTVGDTIIIRDGDEKIGEVKITNPDGSWSWKPEKPLDERDHSISVSARDTAGNESERSPALDFTVDVTKPVTPSAPSAWDDQEPVRGAIVSGEPTNETRPKLSGNGERGSTIIIRDNGEEIGRVQPDQNGNWTWTPDNAFGEGSHNVTVTATDKAGNVSDESAAIVIVVDTTAPVVSMPEVWDDKEPIIGRVEQGGATNDATPVLKGKAEAGSTIVISDNGVKLGEATADADGTWSFAPKEPLAEGSHSITVTETDKAGNRSDSSPSFDFTVDTTAPNATASLDRISDDSGLPGDFITNDSTPTYWITVDTALSEGETVWLRIISQDGKQGAWIKASKYIDGQYYVDTADVDKLTDGTYTIETAVMDRAGNVGAIHSHDITINTGESLVTPEFTATDNTGPVTGDITSGAATDEARPVLKGTNNVGAGNRVIIYIDDKYAGETLADVNGSWSFTPGHDLVNGSHKIKAEVHDVAGNIRTSADLDFTVNAVTLEANAMLESITEDSNVAGDFVTSDNTLRYTVTVDRAIADDEKVLLRIIDKAGNVIENWVEAVKGENGKWTVNLEGSPLKDGEYVVETIVRDVIGNSSIPGKQVVVIDTTAPAMPGAPAAADETGYIKGPITSGGLTDETRPVLSGKGEKGSTVIISDNGVEIGRTTVDKDGSWSWQAAADAALGDGKHKITVVEVDVAGNASEAGNSLDFTVDTAAPAAKAQLTAISEDSGRDSHDFITSNRDLDYIITVDGDLKEGDTVWLRIKDNTGKIVSGWQQAIKNEDGSWIVHKGNAVLDQGDYIVETAVRSTVGNEGIVSGKSITIDTQAPAAPEIISVEDNQDFIKGSIASGGLTNDDRPVFNGRAEANATVDIREGGKIIATVTADADGLWSWQPDEKFTEGKHTVTATATDAAGNVSVGNPVYEFTVDVTPPNGTAWLEAISADTGISDSDYLTNDNTLIYKLGAAGLQAGDTVWVHVKGNGVDAWYQASNQNGSWELDRNFADAALEDGVYTVEVAVRDAAGNIGAKDSQTITIDTQGPTGGTITIDSIMSNLIDLDGMDLLPSGSLINGSEPILFGRASGLEEGAYITIREKSTGRIYGVAEIHENGEWEFKFSDENSLLIGSHDIEAIITDKAGNYGPASNGFDISIVIKGLDQVGSIQGPIMDGGVTDDTHLAISGAADKGALVTISENGKVLGTVTTDASGRWSWKPDVPLAEGDHHLNIAGSGIGAKDNVDFNVTVDTTPPQATAQLIGITEDTGVSGSDFITSDTSLIFTIQIDGVLEKGNAARSGDTVWLHIKGADIDAWIQAAIEPDGKTARVDYRNHLLAEGDYVITAEVRDSAGNRGTLSDEQIVTVDTTPPDATAVIQSYFDDVGTRQGDFGSGTATDDRSPLLKGRIIKGTVGADDMVTIFRDGVIVGRAAINANGSWQFQLNDLRDGEYKYTVAVTDRAGNAGPTSNEFDLLVNTSQPSMPTGVAVIDDFGPITGEIGTSVKLTDDQNPTIKGRAVSGQTVVIYDNGKEIGKTKVNADGTWSFTPQTPLAEGGHSITVAARNAIGAESAPTAPVGFDVDATPPTATAELVLIRDDRGTNTNDFITNDNTLTYDIKVNGALEENATVWLHIKGNGIDKWYQAVPPSGSNPNYIVLASAADVLPDGDYTVETVVHDAAGNAGTVSARQVTIDTVAPEVPTFDSLKDDQGIITGEIGPKGGKNHVTDDAQPKLSGTGEAGSTILIYDGDVVIDQAQVGADGTWEWKLRSGLTNGRHSLSVAAEDVAGNISARTEARDFVVDTVAPVSTVTVSAISDDNGESSRDFITNVSQVDYILTVSSGVVADTETVWMRITDAQGNAGAWIQGVRQADGSWIVDRKQLSALADGTYTIEAVVRDEAGNQGPVGSIREITIDTVAPDAPQITGMEGGQIDGDAISTARPVLKGTAEANSTVELWENGVSLGKTKAGADGSWSIQTDRVLGEGAHHITAIATDVAGNASKPSENAWDFTVDTTAPDAPVIADVVDNVGTVTGSISANGNLTNDPRPVISGTGHEAGNVIIIREGVRELGRTTVGKDGKWSLQIDNPLKGDRTHQITAVEVDHVGNISANSAACEIILDTTPPTKPSVTVSVDTDAGPGTIAGGITNQQPTLSGRTEANAVVTIRNGDKVLATLKADASGSWSAKLQLGEGDYSNITVTAADRAGNESAASKIPPFTIDQTPPVATASLVAISDDSGTVGDFITNDNTLIYTIRVNGALANGDTVWLRIVDASGRPGAWQAAVKNADGTWTLDRNDDGFALADGDYTIETAVRDQAGNFSELGRQTVTIMHNPDVVTPTTPPAAWDDAGESTGWIKSGDVSDDRQPDLSGRAKPGNSIIIRDGDIILGETIADKDGNWKWTPEKPLGEGEHHITTSVKDLAGNESGRSPSLDFTVDTTPPAIPDIPNAADNSEPVIGPIVAGSVTNDSRPVISGKGTAGSTITVRDGSVVLGKVTVDENGAWSLVPQTPLAEGEHHITASETSKAGNTGASSASLDFTVDTIAPAAPGLPTVTDSEGPITGVIKSGDVTDDVRPEFSGKSEPGSTVIVRDGDTVIARVKAGEDGSWSVKPETPLAEGKHTITVSAADAAGNESARSEAVALEVDTTGPDDVIAKLAAISEDRGEVSDDFITNDNTLEYHVTVSRALAEGETVWLRIVDASDKNKVVVDWVQAKYSIKNGYTLDRTASPLDNGKYAVEVTVRDKAGNHGVVSSTDMEINATDVPSTPGKDDFTIWDDVGEIQGQIKSGDMTDDSRPEIKGKGVPGTTIIVEDNGVLLGKTTIGANGLWSFTPELADGNHAITVKVEDKYGNISAPSQAVDFTVNTAPPLAVAVITGISDDTGADAHDYITSDNTLVISGHVNGTVGAGERVQILIGKGFWVDVDYDPATGNWSYDNNHVVLTDGSYVIKTRIVNEAGNSSAIDTKTVVIDTSKPTEGNAVSITSYYDDTAPNTGDYGSGTATNDRTPLLKGTANGLRPGDYINIYQTHGGETVLLGFAKIAADGKSWEFAVPQLQEDGDYQYKAVISNVAGTEGTASTDFDLTLLTGIPAGQAAISAITTDTGIDGDFITSDNTLVIRAGITGTLKPGEKVQIRLPDGSWHDAIYNEASKTWDYDNTNVVLPDGSHTVAARIIDAAGNTNTAKEQVIVVDTSVPGETITIDSYTDDVGKKQGDFGNGTTTDDRDPVLNGSLGGGLKNNEHVVVYLNGDRLDGYAKVYQDSKGQWRWRYALPDLMDKSDNKLVAVIENNAGSQGAKSPDFNIHVEMDLLINTQVTTDHTPIISGSVGFDIRKGEYVEVTVNGVTYSSRNGVVVVDPKNNTWYVQIPQTNRLDEGLYDIGAVLKRADGSVVTVDNTVNELTIASKPDVTVGAGGADTEQKATALTMDENGNWMIFTNQAVMRANGTDDGNIGSFSITQVKSQTGGDGDWGKNSVQSGTWMDYNRDGYMDFFGEDSSYGSGQQAFLNNGDGTFKAWHVGATQGVNGAGNNNTKANVYAWYGGVVAFDKTGEGNVSLAYGDRSPNDMGLWTSGANSGFVINHDGTIEGMAKDWNFTDNSGGSNWNNAQPNMELSGVDLNNDGTVDIIFHGTNELGAKSKIGGAGSNAGMPTSDNGYRLVVVSNNGDVTWTTTQIVENVFQNGSNPGGNVANGISMTWADFDGDGYMDLFMGRGYALDGHSENESRILWNDGGHVSSDAPNGIGGMDRVHWMGDSLAGGPSLAIDWDHDGKMDIIELPGLGTVNGMTAAGNTGPVNLYLNRTVNGTARFETSNLLGAGNTIGSTSNPVTGAVALDLDWDGAKDLLIFTQNGTARFIRNENEVAYGTAMHFKILDQEGINAFYGNTVQLYDSHGKLVGTQIINPQSGNQTSDSSALVDFYGLDPDESYSLVLLRNVNGSPQHVGGLPMLGGKEIQNVNAGWTGLKAGEANHAYVLTAESDKAENNAMIGHGIVGTGYNDTFIATKGLDIYSGAGGTISMGNEKHWSNTGGTDIVDYKLAGSQGVNVDLSIIGFQNTGYNVAKFDDIEGIYGSDGNDTFTDNEADNIFNGRGGDDTFYLTKGGHDTLLYELIDSADGTGGNGHDTVYGFKVGTWEATPGSDRVDLANLLVGYKADSDGAAHYIDGVAKIDAGDSIEDYLRLTRQGNNAILEIDRDGKGDGFGFEALLTLTNLDKDVDLATLLANHQIII